MLRRRHFSTGELQEVYVSIAAARTEILSRKVPKSGETTRRAMLRVVETMEGWMRMIVQAQMGLVTCWTTLEGLEGDMGCARRYIDRSEIISWERLPRSLGGLRGTRRRGEPVRKSHGEGRAIIERQRAMAEAAAVGESEEGIRRAMQVVAWTLEEWLVRGETADTALAMCGEAYEELEQDLRTVRKVRPGTARRGRRASRAKAAAEAKKTASTRESAARRGTSQGSSSSGGS